MCRHNRRWYIETQFGKFVLTKMSGHELQFSDKEFELTPLLFSNLKQARDVAKRIGGTVRFHTAKDTHHDAEFPF